MKKHLWLLIIFMVLPNLAQAWWNEEWGYKKKISLDTIKLQQSGVQVVDESLALVRLHTGNFSYFLDVADKGKDIRFIAADDVTPLKFYIEQLDPINEMAMIWVKLPQNMVTAEQPHIWMYYSNPAAVDGQDVAGIFDVAQALSYPFGQNGVRDLTAYGNHPTEANIETLAGGVVAEQAVFKGDNLLKIPDSPSLQMNPESGWTVSAWIKIDESQDNSVVWQRGGLFALGIKDQTPYLEMGSAETETATQTLTADKILTFGNWHHIAVVAENSSVNLYIDGTVTATLAVALPVLSGEITVGADASAKHGFIGNMDQFSIAKVARDAVYLSYTIQMQGMGSPLLVYGDDISPDDVDEGEASYMISILNNVSIDGWIIIGMLALMFAVSWLVMLAKGLVIRKINQENSNFMEEFEKLGVEEMEKLNREDSEDDLDSLESPLLLSLTGGHEKFQGSSIYRLYHVGVEEINRRLVKAVGADVVDQTLTPQSMEAIRAKMDGALVREVQRLNSQMVLLTIAISGGPFLGLLGTVMGVMITFAAIAIQGEVNVNAIAPGISAALATTVAGLAVAIPALFGYNYLGSRIKEAIADMHVFVDEYVAMLAERYS